MKNYTKQISALALVMSLGLAAGAANANIVDTTSLDANGYAYSPVYSAGTSFTDIFSFTVPANNSVVAGLSYIPADVTISSFSILTSSNGVVPSVADWSTPGVPSLTTSSLTGGTYEINVQGNALTDNGTYTVGVAVSPVPEPTEGALLLSGIGLLGFIAARRNRNEA